MGVTQLWNILEPVKRAGDLSQLKNKRLCVDISVWIVEALGSKALKVNVARPHLRNLFFRIYNLVRAGVKLLFVVDGDPPKVKWEAILKRTQTRSAGRGKGSSAGGRQRVGRSHFRIWVNECIKLLKLLGVPYVESAGEAEALCAWLNSKGIVDGCVTNDGDVFLYGGRTVYKDLSISVKSCSMDYYKMADIETELGLTRENLVGLAILLGCDYLPQGVPGVGKENGLKLINELQISGEDIDLLKRFNNWSQTNFDCHLSKTEESIRKKALKVPGFPSREVINEFLSPNLKTQYLTVPKDYKCPDFKGLQDFCLKYLEWPEDYTMEKVLPLVTCWQMNHILADGVSSDIVTSPLRIVKLRNQNKIECYEVQWSNIKLGDTCSTSFTTIEYRSLFKAVYPTVVEEFELTHVKTTKKQAKSKVKKTVDSDNELEGLCENLDSLSLASKQSSLPEVKDTVMKCNKEANCKSNDLNLEGTCIDNDYHGDDDNDGGGGGGVSSDDYEYEPRDQETKHRAGVADLSEAQGSSQHRTATASKQSKCQKKQKVPPSVRPHQREDTIVNNRKPKIYPPYISDSDSDSWLLDDDFPSLPDMPDIQPTGTIPACENEAQKANIFLKQIPKTNDQIQAQKPNVVQNTSQNQNVFETQKTNNVKKQVQKANAINEVRKPKVSNLKTNIVPNQAAEPNVALNQAQKSNVSAQEFLNDSDCKNDSVILIEDKPTTEDLDDFVLLSLSQRLSKKYLGQRNVLDTLQTLSTIDK